MPPRAIQPLADRLDLRPALPEFHRLAGKMLGVAASESDGFSARFSDAHVGFAFGSPALAAIDPLLDDSQAAARVITEDTLAMETMLLSRDVENGRQLVRESNDIAGVGNPFEDEQPSGAGTPRPLPGVSNIVRPSPDGTFGVLSPERAEL